MIEDIAEVLDEFKHEIIPDTRRRIKELIAEADPEMKRQAHIEYLKGRMKNLVLEGLHLIGEYENARKTDNMDIRIFLGRKFLETVKEISRLQGEIIKLRRPEKAKGGVSEDEIKRAREHPFDQLIELNRNKKAPCPFHGDQDPSFSVKNNRGYCFGCQWNGDTIAFLMDKDGLTFFQAVRKLQ